MNRRKLVFLVIGIAIAAGSVLLSQAPPPPQYVIPSDLSWFAPSFRCPTGNSASFANYVAWDAPQQCVVVGIQEKNPATNQWVAAQYVYPTSFNVLDVAYRLGGQELYVAGIQINRAGGYTDIIEKWVFPTPAGSYLTTITGGVTPIGTARASLASTVTIVGGSYATPSQRIRTPQPVPSQTIIYSQPMGGHFNCIVADPEGRFLLMHNYTTGNVLSLDLAATNPVPQVLYAPAQISALSGTRLIVLHDIPGFGRVCRLSPEDRSGVFSAVSTDVVFLIDVQNDGIFEIDTVHSRIDVAKGLSPYGDSKDWKSVTNFGWDWHSEY